MCYLPSPLSASTIYHYWCIQSCPLGLDPYPVTFLPAHSINIKQLRHPPSVWRTNVSHGVFTILSATYKQSIFMYILYNQLPLYVCALWKKNKYSFFLSYLKANPQTLLWYGWDREKSSSQNTKFKDHEKSIVFFTFFISSVYSNWNQNAVYST